MDPLRVRLAGPAPRRRGGVSAHVRALMPALARRSDVKVTYVATGRRPSERRGLRAAARDVAGIFGGDHELLHLNPSLRPRALARDGWLAALSSVRTPVVVHVHGWDEELASRIGRDRARRTWVRATLGRHRVLAVAPGAVETLQEWGIEAACLGPALDLEALPSERLPEAGRILFLGRLSRDKGVFHLLDAFVRVAADRPESALVLAGAGPDGAALAAAVRARGLQARVELPGWLDGADRIEALGRARVLALPSATEACPLAVLEALAVDCPVVATPVGCLPLWVPEAGLGSAEPAHLAERLLWALDAPGPGRADQVRRQHDPDHIAEVLVEAWTRAAR